MLFKRSLIGPLVVAAGLIVVGIHRVAASPAPAPTVKTSETPVVQIDDAAKTWHIAGTIQMMNGQFWDVQGFVIQVTNATQITGDLPTIGTFIDARGTVQSDGTWLATFLVVNQSESVTPSVTSTATSTPPSTATPTPSSTSTPTPTSTATASSTPIPTNTPATDALPPSDDHDATTTRPPAARPIRLPIEWPPRVPNIQKLISANNQKDSDQQNHPHPAHPAQSQMNKNHSSHGQGRRHGHGD